jgi:hypothetical protein
MGKASLNPKTLASGLSRLGGVTKVRFFDRILLVEFVLVGIDCPTPNHCRFSVEILNVNEPLFPWMDIRHKS